MTLVHGTVVDVGGKGVLLRGPSGSGKSDLALRLVDRGATFVSDDQIILEKRSRGILASAPPAIRGYMEVRGLGLISLPVIGGSYLELVVDLVPAAHVERLPEKTYVDLCGEKIASIALNAFELSSVLKIELAVRDTSIIAGEGPRGQGQ